MFEPRTREDESVQAHYQPIERLFYEVNEAPDALFAERVREWLNLDDFVKIVAVQAYLAEWDGLAGSFGLNNFYLCRPAEGGPFHVVPWDADNTFHALEYPVDQDFSRHVLVRRALEHADLRRLFFETLEQSVRLAEAPDDSAPASDPGEQRGWLEREIQRRHDLIAQRVRDDRAKPYATGDFEAAVAELGRFARERGAFVRREGERLGWRW